MSSLSVRLFPEELRLKAFGAIGATYSLVSNGAGTLTTFTNPIKILFIQNLTNAALLFSFDGTTNHLILPQNGHFAIDISANKSNPGTDLELNAGLGVWVKQSGVPSSGSVYVTAFYAN